MNSFDRVRANTSDTLNTEFDREIARQVRPFEGRSKAAITRRIDELDRRRRRRCHGARRITCGDN